MKTQENLILIGRTPRVGLARRARRLLAGLELCWRDQLIGDYHGTDRDGVDCDLFMTGDIDGVQVWSQALPVDTIWRALASLFQLSR